MAGLYDQAVASVGLLVLGRALGRAAVGEAAKREYRVRVGDVLAGVGIGADGALEILAGDITPACHRAHRPPPVAGVLLVEDEFAHHVVAGRRCAKLIVFLAQIIVEEGKQIVGFAVFNHPLSTLASLLIAYFMSIGNNLL